LRRPAGALLATVLAASILGVTPSAYAVDGTITGTVTGSGGLPLENVSVDAYAEVTDDEGFTSWEIMDNEHTDVDGNYSISLAAGTYRIGFRPMVASGLAEEFHDDQASIETARDVVVPTVTDIDAVLAEASQITGTVTDVANAPLAGVEVYAYVSDDSSWENQRSTAHTVTDAIGHYTLAGLAKGAYRVEFEGQSSAGFLYEAWNNKGRIEEGDDIAVLEDVDVSNIDAKLVAGEHDPVPFTMTAMPTISGTPQVGSTLTVTGGSWVPTPATTDYYWFRGEEYTGVSATTYVPTAADLGKTLSVLVQVWGSEGQYDFANTGNYGPIVAAPVAAVPPVVVPAPAPVLAPVISFSKKIDVVGKLVVGSTLKLKNYKALVTQVAATAAYKIQWYAGSKKIKRATKSKLKVNKAMKGKKILVKVTATVGSTSKTVKVKVGTIR
jgi:hypothetical protein